MPETEEVKAEIQESVRSDDFVMRLAERVGAQTRADAVFGDPVERKGITVIPVARAVWGFGGGSGTEAGKDGSGGGGGGAAVPLGHIEVRNGYAEFKPLRDPRTTALVAAAAMGLAAVALGFRRR
jgi:uncharacterized spore protein YtfJ